MRKMLLTVFSAFALLFGAVAPGWGQVIFITGPVSYQPGYVTSGFMNPARVTLGDPSGGSWILSHTPDGCGETRGASEPTMRRLLEGRNKVTWVITQWCSYDLARFCFGQHTNNGFNVLACTAYYVEQRGDE